MEASEIVADFLNFNDNTVGRRPFYQALNVVLDIMLDDGLELADYLPNLERMYGAEAMEAVVGSVTG